MKPSILFIGLSLMILGSLMIVFFYPNFSEISAEKGRLDMVGASSLPLLSRYYSQVAAQYQQLVISVICGVVLLIIGSGVTIHGATKIEARSKMEISFTQPSLNSS